MRSAVTVIHRDLDDPAEPPSSSARPGQRAAPTIDRVLGAQAQRALVLVDAHGVAIAIREDPVFVCRAAAGELSPEVGVSVGSDAGLTRHCIETGRTVVSNHASTDPRVDVALLDAGIRSLLIVPITRGPSVLGVIELFAREGDRFDAAAQQKIERVALAIADLISAGDTTQLANVPLETRVAKQPAAPSAQPPAPLKAPARNHVEPSAAATTTPAPLPDFLVIAPTEQRSRRRALLVGGAFVVLAVLSLIVVHELPTTGAETQASAVQQPSIDVLKNAAENGNVGAQSALATYYWTGHGVAQDYEAAYMWSAIAAAQGDANSKGRLQLLRASMAPESITRAENRKQEWLRQHPLVR